MQRFADSLTCMFEAVFLFSASSFDLCFPRLQKSTKKEVLFSVPVSWKHYGKENTSIILWKRGYKERTEPFHFGVKLEEFHEIFQPSVFADNVSYLWGMGK